MGCLEVEVEGEAGNIAVSFTSTVLSLRGRDGVTGQPLVDESSGSMLCWNGEAWKMAGRSIRGNDGRRVLDELLAAGGSRRDQGDGILINVLRSIEGPFAFVYLDKPAKRLYYGRDRLGRRSLLVKTGDPLCFSSVTDGSPCHWLEVEADGIYSLHLDVGTLKTGFKETKYYWAEDENLVRCWAPPVTGLHFDYSQATKHLLGLGPCSIQRHGLCIAQTSFQRFTFSRCVAVPLGGISS